MKIAVRRLKAQPLLCSNSGSKLPAEGAGPCEFTRAVTESNCLSPNLALALRMSLGQVTEMCSVP